MSLVLLFLVFSSSLQQLPTRPVRSFHGYAGSCSNLAQRDPGVCVETGGRGDSIRNSIESQANLGCILLTREINNLRNGFYIVAYSQGGLIARHIFHRCNQVNKYIRRIIFVGAPHLGVGDSTPNRLLRQISNEEDEWPRPEGKASSFQGRFLRSSDYTNRGGGTTAFLNDVNSNAWDPLYANLELIVNFVSKTESTVSPAFSTGMGAQYLGGNRIQDANTVPYFNRHQNGVLAMFNAGRLFNCLSDAGHNRFTNAEIFLVYNLLLKEHPLATNYYQSAKLQMERFFRAYPTGCSGVI